MESLLKKLHDFRNEAINVKNDKTPGNPWGEDEDKHMRNLELWIRIAESEAETSIEYFQQSPMFRHDSFKDFLSSYSYEWASFYGKAGNKIKTSRATSKVSKCPRCESMTRVEEDRCICTNSKCGYSWRIAPSVSKTAVDPMKHTKNKIEMLIGTKHPPKKIVDLLPQISIWLTDLNYLYDWLRYKDQNIVQKDSISFDEWMFELKRIYRPKDATKKWSMIIPQEPRYAWTFLEFKLIISEMSGMLSECVRRSYIQFTSSNMKNLNEDMIIKIAIVDGLQQAIDHINKYGTHHSDAIVTEDAKAAEAFCREVDSGAVYVNASTRFTDGYEFGLGAEMGISTQKLHVRGPIGLKELTSVKYVIKGNGTVR